jgi:hypothetical protein
VIFPLEKVRNIEIKGKILKKGIGKEIREEF